MLSELLQDKAAQYVSGGMPVPERESFEVVLEFHPELRALVASLGEVAAAATVAQLREVAAPAAALKDRILRSAATRPAYAEPEALVATDPAGRIEWVNAAFTAMCGYSLDELKGKKPGQLLQGPDTDPRAVEHIRNTVRSRTSCREALVNYHKDGSPYRVEVRIAPVLDDEGNPLWFVARERKLEDLAPAAAR